MAVELSFFFFRGASTACGGLLYFPAGVCAHSGYELIDWPPLTGDGFVVNCCGDDPLGCVKFLRSYYTDA